MEMDRDAKAELVDGNTRFSHRQKNRTVAASVLAKTGEPSCLALSAASRETPATRNEFSGGSETFRSFRPSGAAGRSVDVLRATDTEDFETCSALAISSCDFPLAAQASRLGSFSELPAVPHC